MQDVADTVKDHKRKHDTDDDDYDDNKGPSARPNQGKTSKKKRTRESESAKKPSTTKETSKDIAPKKDSKTGKSAPAEEPVEEPTKEVSMDEQPTKDILSPDDMHVLYLEDTNNAHIPKVIPPSDLPEADNNWANSLAKTYQYPDENKLHNKTGDIGSFIKWYYKRIGKDKLSKANFKDYTIVYKPRAVIYRDKNEQKKMMRIHEVHKFVNGTLTRIKDKLDFMVKDFKLFEYNKGMESRIWSEDDK
nr:hypothetical protein [Tanacetum cinerariifolium]